MGKIHTIITTDNSSKEFDLGCQEIDDLYHIADQRLDKLTDENNSNLWIFPTASQRHGDKIEKEIILSLSRNCTGGTIIKTGNIMGFVGYNQTELTIRSRFSQKGNDWFMQYMLQKVFAINIFKLSHSKNEERALDIAALLFPHFLQKAMCQGIYREYIRCHHNETCVKGSIDVNAHIKYNYPFKNGKIAYSTREYKYDNTVTQLIRHTIEFLKSDPKSYEIINSAPEIQEYINQIVNATPSYRRGDLRKILLANARPKIHPYYSNYRPLQKLCLQILKHEKLGYETSSEQIHGVLFDGAWLWEEYLNLILSKAGFEHPKNKEKTGEILPFLDRPNRYKRYPDFKTENIIVDAKYKYMMSKREKTELLTDNIQRDDLSQMISYLHITSSNIGIFICPNEFVVMNPISGSFDASNGFVLKCDEYYIYKVGKLAGDGGIIQIIGMNIPKKADTYKDFVTAMKCVENALMKKFIEIKSYNNIS